MLRRRLLDDHGFTMVAVTLTMMALGMFAVAAWSAAIGDIPIARHDQDRKRAYEAAQAGAEWYSFQLQKDPTFWEQCGTVASAPWVRNQWTSGADPRVKRTLTASDEQYTIEILNTTDTAGNPVACDPANPGTTGLQDGTLRIRSTGYAKGQARSVVATYKRRGFLDFIYFTSYETQDPAVSGLTSTNCAQPRTLRPGACIDIQFSGTDKINGPFHTNDSSILVCNAPIFGRVGKSDSFEVAGVSPGYDQLCSGTPTFNGPVVTPAATVQAPASNGTLKTQAGASWTFTGQTCLRFNNTSVDIITSNSSWATAGKVMCDGTTVTKPLIGAGAPPNGVIYVATGTGASCGYTKREIYDNSPTCGDVAVRGTYTTPSVTIGSDNDVIVNGDLVRSGNGMVGLIANKFIRVYHPFTGMTSSACGTEQTPQWGYVAEIDAAMLALNDSFMVDNYDCGPAHGNLTVNGAIAQLYRGTVATSNSGTIVTGYAKNYIYDDRLKYRDPPNFLDPVKTSWQAVRQTEQTPATK
jgi:hypothetical protein